MAHVINSNERNQAFLKFIIFFLVTIILIVCAVYVDFRGLPQKRQKLFEEELAKVRTETQRQKLFVQQMEAARLLLDSLDKSGKNRHQVEAELEGKLRDMETLRPRDSSLNGKLDATISDALFELQQQKIEIEKLQSLASKVRELESKLAESQSALDTYRSQVQPVPGQPGN